MLTRTEAALVAAYERARRARFGFRKVPSWAWQQVAAAGWDPLACFPLYVTRMDEEEIRALRGLVEDLVRAEDPLRDHISEYGPVEARGWTYRLDGRLRVTCRRDDHPAVAAPSRSIQ